MGVSTRLLLLIVLCLAPSVVAEVLIARGLLPATVGVPASIAAALVLAGFAGRRLLLRPLHLLLRDLQSALPGGVHSAQHLTEFGALAQGIGSLADELARQDGLHQQRTESLQALLAERTRALSESNNRLQFALADLARAAEAREAAERQRLAGQLAGGVAHDFNNLLATVLGCLELMDRRLADPDRLRVLIGRASDAVDRATKLTSGLVHFARRQSQPRRPTDLNALVSDLAPLIASALGRRVRLRTELAPTLGLAHADPAGMEMALVGICVAARAAIPNGGEIVLATRAEAALPATTGPCRAIAILIEGDDLGEPNLADARCMAERAGAIVQLGGGGSAVEIALLLPCAEHGSDALPITALSVEPRHPNLG